MFGIVSQADGAKPVNVASVPQRSPFRYPGGKTWFIPRLREWLLGKFPKPKTLIEPFAGGGIVSLTAAFEDLAETVLMVEIDDEVAAVWETIMSGKGEWLAQQVLSFKMSRDAVIAELAIPPVSIKEKAFQTILKNRTLHGGILASGSGFLKTGESGKGVLSRWYPETLSKRIKNISHVFGKLTFYHGDGFDVIEHYKNDENVAFFIDPPYTAGGKKAGSRLYTHSQLEHDRLFHLCSELKGDFIMTYDNALEVRELAKKHGLQAKPISMKNTHHMEMTELVIGRDLGWMEGVTLVFEGQAKYGVRKCSKKR
jgi:DNA adenine methylase